MPPPVVTLPTEKPAAAHSPAAAPMRNGTTQAAAPGPAPASEGKAPLKIRKKQRVGPPEPALMASDQSNTDVATQSSGREGAQGGRAQLGDPSLLGSATTPSPRPAESPAKPSGSKPSPTDSLAVRQEQPAATPPPVRAAAKQSSKKTKKQFTGTLNNESDMDESDAEAAADEAGSTRQVRLDRKQERHDNKELTVSGKEAASSGARRSDAVTRPSAEADTSSVADVELITRKMVRKAMVCVYGEDWKVSTDEIHAKKLLPAVARIFMGKTKRSSSMFNTGAKAKFDNAKNAAETSEAEAKDAAARATQARSFSNVPPGALVEAEAKAEAAATTAAEAKAEEEAAHAEYVLFRDCRGKVVNLANGLLSEVPEGTSTDGNVNAEEAGQVPAAAAAGGSAPEDAEGDAAVPGSKKKTLKINIEEWVTKDMPLTSLKRVARGITDKFLGDVANHFAQRHHGGMGAGAFTCGAFGALSSDTVWRDKVPGVGKERLGQFHAAIASRFPPAKPVVAGHIQPLQMDTSAVHVAAPHTPELGPGLHSLRSHMRPFI